MENKKGKAKAPRKAKTPAQRRKKSKSRGAHPPGRKPPESKPPAPPRPTTEATPSPLHPAVALIVSLLAPGLGLLLLERKDRVKDAFLIFGLWFSYLALSFFLSFFVIGVCCWLPLPLLNLAAGIHSFDEMTLEQGGRPVLFQSSFRIFQD